MYLCLCSKDYSSRKGFENTVLGQAVCFDGCGSIKAAAIYRMSKSRYRVYAILDGNGFRNVLCNGIGAALDYLQELYNRFG